MYGDDNYAGTRITCPSCQGEIVVPQAQSIPAGRLQVETVAVVTPKSPPPRPIPSTPIRAAYMPKDSGSDNSSRKMIVTVSIICVLVLSPIIAYFAFPDQVAALEQKFGFAGKKIDPDEGGGQLGHIADLYSVLDATDPDKMFASDDKEMARLEKAERAAEKARQDAELAEANAPLGEVSWNLNPAEDEFPTGKPHGAISGTNFVADVVRLDSQNNQFLLTMRQGTNAVADCEMQVYLQLKPNELIDGKSWTISTNQKVGAPKVVKKWKANPKFAPLQKVYAGGYAMRIEFGESERGLIPGRIYLALPDVEKSYVAGWFKVDDGRISLSERFEAGDF
jgi:hypothetical protein